MTPDESRLVDEITRLRAALQGAVTFLVDILDDGLPGIGQCRADRDYFDCWWARLEDTVRRAKDALNETDEYDGL